MEFELRQKSLARLIYSKKLTSDMHMVRHVKLTEDRQKIPHDPTSTHDVKGGTKGKLWLPCSIIVCIPTYSHSHLKDLYRST